MKQEILRWKEIKSEDDLPKVEVTYDVVTKSGNRHRQAFINTKVYRFSWMRNIESYLIPAETETITVWEEVPTNEDISEDMIRAGEVWLRKTTITIIKKNNHDTN